MRRAETIAPAVFCGPDSISRRAPLSWSIYLSKRLAVFDAERELLEFLFERDTGIIAEVVSCRPDR